MSCAGVDANRMGKTSGNARGLRGVAADHYLFRDVRPTRRKSCPAQHDGRLLIKRQLRIDAAVNEKVVGGLVNITAGVIQKIPVSLWHLIQIGRFFCDAVGAQCVVPATPLPELQQFRAASGIHHHFLVIAPQWNEMVAR